MSLLIEVKTNDLIGPALDCAAHWPDCSVGYEMSAIAWTEEEIVEFDGLVDDISSQLQMVRIAARMDMTKFVQEHGKEKCDAMFAHLEAGGDRVAGSKP